MKKMSKEWMEVMKVLIKYKLADKGTAESSADEICKIFSDTHPEA